MSDWMDIINWLNQNSGFVMALLTCVYVLCTVILCICAWRSNSLSLKLHQDVYRPFIVCDFLVQYSCIYFRIKNLGNQSGKNIRIKANGPPPYRLKSWDEHSVIKEGISFLSPGSEMISFFATSSQKDIFSTVGFTITYENFVGQKFDEQTSINLECWSSLDVARENNNPILLELKKIKSAIEKSN